MLPATGQGLASITPRYLDLKITFLDLVSRCTFAMASVVSHFISCSIASATGAFLGGGLSFILDEGKGLGDMLRNERGCF